MKIIVTGGAGFIAEILFITWLISIRNMIL